MNGQATTRNDVASAIVTILVLALGLFFCPKTAHAQNAGTVGINAQQITVFTNQTGAASSPIFKDIGQGLNLLFYCTTAYTGTIDIEWSPTKAAPFYAIQQANYPNTAPDTGCHTLQAGGYFPNMRATMNGGTGSISAWYTASGAPISFVSAGIGTNGPSSPITCDRNTTQAPIATGTTSAMGIGPLLPGDTDVICAFTVSFEAAPTTGQIFIGWSVNTNCSGTLLGPTWFEYTTANTPQRYTVEVEQRSGNPAVYQTPCLVNQSGATVSISTSFASVHNL